jgi:mevalonate kinase
METCNFFSKAKIILLGEYAVMHGAQAICLPLATGQKMTAIPADHSLIRWTWNYKKEDLADFSLDCHSLEVHKILIGNPEWVINLLRLIRLQNPGFLKQGFHLHFENYFPAQWGLGSSSATISSLCRYAGINPYLINYELTGGSGADIACTTQTKWFTYQKTASAPDIWKIIQDYPFAENTFFIYSGHKQATASHLKKIKFPEATASSLCKEVNRLVNEFLVADDISKTEAIIKEHENLISETIQQPPVGLQFPDFDGQIKSLGAWGGDFFMAISRSGYSTVKKYFQQKGYETVFSWNELVKSDKF